MEPSMAVSPSQTIHIAIRLIRIRHNIHILLLIPTPIEIVLLFVLVCSPLLIILPLQLTSQILIHILHALGLILVFAFRVRDTMFQ